MWRLLGLVVMGIAPSTGWAQAMVEVPNAPPPPAPHTVTEAHRAPSRYEVIIDVTPGIAVPLGASYGADFGPSFTMDGHVGLAIWMRGRRFALVPELSVGGTSLTRERERASYGSGFSRVRGEAAMRVLVPLGHHLRRSTRASPSVATTSRDRLELGEHVRRGAGADADGGNGVVVLVRGGRRAASARSADTSRSARTSACR